MNPVKRWLLHWIDPDLLATAEHRAAVRRVTRESTALLRELEDVRARLAYVNEQLRVMRRDLA